MVETRSNQQNNIPNSRSSGSSSQSSQDISGAWTQVVSRGARKKKKQNFSFKPTIVQRSVTDQESSQQVLNDSSSPAPFEVVCPFIKGMEQDSVLIDLSTVKDRSLLNKALLKFNESAEKSDYYEEFLGYRKQTRNYLGHAFLETMWLPTSNGFKTILESGITLADGPFFKGFKSYPADASIVRLTLENLPFLPALLLKAEMEKRLSCFGDVLDLGISKTDGIFNGEGYATINLTLNPALEDNQCNVEHEKDSTCTGLKHLEPLSRVIVWNDKDIEQRKILLQWDRMPDFCRNCQSTDHCRADCPDYKKWIRCYHCNQTGHVFQVCPRNDSITSAPGKVRAVAATSPKKGRKTSKGSSDTKKAAPPQTGSSSRQSIIQGHEQTKDKPVDSDQLMEEVASHTIIDSSTEAPTSDFSSNVSIDNKPDATMTEASSKSPRSPHLEPSHLIAKVPRTFDSIDISSSRPPSTGPSTSTTLNIQSINSTNDQENLSPPETSGDHPPNLQ